MKQLFLSDVKLIRGLSMLIVFTAALFCSCTNNDVYQDDSLAGVNPPVMGSISVVSNTIVYNAATVTFEVTGDGGKSPNQVGVCWSTEEMPELTSSTARKNLISPGVGTFNSGIGSLNHNTTYYVRAYASNPAGTTYSEQISFHTAILQSPSLGAASVAAGTLTFNSVTINASVVNEGDAALNLMGVCWSTSENPTRDTGSKLDVTPVALGPFSAALSSLQKNTTYYARAYAGSSAGIAYGEQITFTTLDVDLPTFSDMAIVPGTLKPNSVSLSIEILTAGGAPLTRAAIVWATAADFAPASILGTITMSPLQTGVFQANITGLTDGTVYYARATVENQGGSVVGVPLSFKTTLVESLMYYAPRNMLIGGTMEAPLGTTPEADKIVEENYNAIQIPAYPASYNGWPSQDVHNTAALKEWADWAKGKNKEAVGHFLIGGPNIYYPDWLKTPAIPWTAGELDAMLEARIKAVIQGAGANITKWVVVNEPFNSGDRQYVASVWNAMGTVPSRSGDASPIPAAIPVYIEKAFEYAAKYAPNAELILCERGIERSTLTENRAVSILQLVKHLQATGVKLDAIAVQGHHSFAAGGWTTETVAPPSTGTPAPIRWDVTCDQIARYQALGLKFYFNEVDCGRNNTSLGAVQPAEQEEYTRLQQMHYRNFLLAAIQGKVGGGTVKPINPVNGIFFWGLGDGHDPAFRPNDQAQLYDFNHAKKPAYYTVLEYLQETGLYK